MMGRIKMNTWVDAMEEDYKDVEETFIPLTEDNNQVAAEIYKQLVAQCFRERREWAAEEQAEFKQLLRFEIDRKNSLQ